MPSWSMNDAQATTNKEMLLNFIFALRTFARQKADLLEMDFFHTNIFHSQHLVMIHQHFLSPKRLA